MKIEDKLVIRELQHKNIAVFEAIFHDYYPHLLQFAERFVIDRDIAEDIVQNIFVSLWENAARLQITSSLRTYLYVSVKNRCLNHLRQLKIEDKHHLLFIEACLNDDNLSQDDSELFHQIQQAIQALPPKMAEIFRLKYLDEKSIKDISSRLEISENTVKTQLLRGKTKLKSLLKKSIDINFLL